MVVFVEDDSGNENESIAGLSEIGSTDEGTDTPSDKEEELAKAETKAVFRQRLLVFVALFVASVLVSVVVYFVTANAEKNAYEVQYDGSAGKMLESFEGIVSKKLEAIGSLALAVSAFAQGQNASFPFVTTNAFQRRSQSARQLSSALLLSVAFVVSDEDRLAYENYTLSHQGWIEEGRAYQKETGIDSYLSRRSLEETSSLEVLDKTNSTEQIPFDFRPFDVSSRIYEYSPQFKPVVSPSSPFYTPLWQSSPVLAAPNTNVNLLKLSFRQVVAACIESGELVIGGFDRGEPGDRKSSNPQTAVLAELLSIAAKKETSYDGRPFSSATHPIYSINPNGSKRQVVGVIVATINWASYFENILPPNSPDVTLVLESRCSDNHLSTTTTYGVFSYAVSGPTVTPLGFGDLHDKRFDHFSRSTSFRELGKNLDLETTLNQEYCPYKLTVYPSRDTFGSYRTSLPPMITSAIAIIFVFTAFMFVFYDRLVERRQQLVMKKATQTGAIVSSLFPETIRDRLIERDDADAGVFSSPGHRLKSFLNGEDEEDEGITMATLQKPLADTFPHSTVLFADISGFTSWSSTRDPSQVFILLQTVYHAFDMIAKRNRVFKVETIGDSYVAVTGIPIAQPHHATIMARFAWECMRKMQKLAKKLEVVLGPDTGDLKMRFGMHSGPCTAGVLRGDKSRFQLFGDTVNTAARMESTGCPDMIQASHTTAELLIAAGKGHWLTPRRDSVLAKGKGVLSTFWIAPRIGRGARSDCGDSADTDSDSGSAICSNNNKKHNRLVEWVSELLLLQVRKVVAKRGTQAVGSCPIPSFPAGSHTFLDEVAEVITLPEFDPHAVMGQTNHEDDVELSLEVVTQLHEFVSSIASTYRDNAFHNFEHACHVTMAVDKFLKRIVAPDLDLEQLGTTKETRGALASHLHNYTHGINSDPITLLAIVFSALIHDVDHKGVSNIQLCKEDKKIADKYKNKSAAEQHSLEISWELLMSNKFRGLRECMFADQAELLRFRQVLVNVVLATDIFDKELNDLRKNRWEKAFGAEDSSHLESTPDHSNDLRATIVIEHIIQASDVSHCMQHWHVYRKWNARLFQEMYVAFQAGRMEADPSTFWYKGELKFFDNYIIPLAKKLKNCGVFGVSSDECLTYALQNRAEWEEKGEEVLHEMVKEVKAQQLMMTDHDTSSLPGEEAEPESSSREKFTSSPQVEVENVGAGQVVILPGQQPLYGDDSLLEI